MIKRWSILAMAVLLAVGALLPGVRPAPLPGREEAVVAYQRAERAQIGLTDRKM